MSASPPKPLARHHWVWLNSGWRELAASPLDAEAAALAEDWRAAGRPFVVAARAGADAPGYVRLGLATPEKRRHALRLRAAAVARTAPPPALDERILAVAPPSWRGVLRRVANVAQEAGLSVAVYGSLAWTAMSGVGFLCPESDVDLLFRLSAPRERRGIYRLFALWAEIPAPRLDGEFLLPDGRAAPWRELAVCPNEVLVKGAGAPLLLPRAAVEAAAGLT